MVFECADRFRELGFGDHKTAPWNTYHAAAPGLARHDTVHGADRKAVLEGQGHALAPVKEQAGSLLDMAAHCLLFHGNHLLLVL